MSTGKQEDNRGIAQYCMDAPPLHLCLPTVLLQNEETCDKNKHVLSVELRVRRAVRVVMARHPG